MVSTIFVIKIWQTFVTFDDWKCIQNSIFVNVCVYQLKLVLLYSPIKKINYPKIISLMWKSNFTAKVTIIGEKEERIKSARY